MINFRHIAALALTLTVSTGSVFAHVPRDLLSAPIRVHSRPFVVHTNFENRLVLCDSASLRETLFYSADGSRVAAETVAGGSTNLTIFVLDHGDPLRRPLAELDASGQPLRYFVWGNGLVAQIDAGSGSVRYFHADGQGSTLALTDATAAVTDQWFHDPYGETLNRTGSTATPYQWIGGHGVRAESSGLHFMRHRYYHAGLKRFVTEDPIGLAGGVNLYAYGGLNPLFWMDPWGLCPQQGGGGLNLWTRTTGVGQSLYGLGQGAVGFTFGTVTSPTIAGGLAGAAIMTHGVDNFQAGLRQAATGQPVDTMTSGIMQSFGMSRNAANTTEAIGSALATGGAGYMNITRSAVPVVQSVPTRPNENTVRLYHQGNLQGGRVSSTRALSTSPNSSLQHYRPQGQLYEFRVPQSTLNQWQYNGLAQPRTDLHFPSGIITPEIRVMPPASGQLNQFMISH